VSTSGDKPLTSTVRELTPTWAAGVALMVKGEKRRAWLPGQLVSHEQFGDSRPAGTPEPEDVVIDTELLDVVDMPKPAPTPVDVAAPPARVSRTASGVGYRLLSSHAGTSAPRPLPSSIVTVNYTAWTPDGNMFASSFLSGQPETFQLSKAIRGLRDGLNTMRVGDTTRFWIPAELAFDDSTSPQAGPHGMVVFDVELLYVYTADGQRGRVRRLEGRVGLQRQPTERPSGRP